MTNEKTKKHTHTHRRFKCNIMYPSYHQDAFTMTRPYVVCLFNQRLLQRISQRSKTNTYIGQQLVGSHTAHYHQITQNHLEIIWPELAQCSPQLFDVTWMGIRKLQKIKIPNKTTTSACYLNQTFFYITQTFVEVTVFIFCCCEFVHYLGCYIEQIVEDHFSGFRGTGTFSSSSCSRIGEILEKHTNGIEMLIFDILVRSIQFSTGKPTFLRNVGKSFDR